jgi:hypothetical protein
MFNPSFPRRRESRAARLGSIATHTNLDSCLRGNDEDWVERGLAASGKETRNLLALAVREEHRFLFNAGIIALIEVDYIWRTDERYAAYRWPQLGALKRRPDSRN